MEIFGCFVFAWFFIHFIECFVFRKLIAKSPDGRSKAFFYTMMFGYFYLKRIKNMS